MINKNDQRFIGIHRHHQTLKTQSSRWHYWRSIGLCAGTGNRIKKNIGIQELISESVLHLNVDDDINTELSIAENMGNIYIDPEQINNVIKTLYDNAIQAMPDGGDILIKAQKEHGNLEIVFTDNGCGIKKDYLSKIFEPLFTTKQHHIGLGLATAKQLIELNGGTIIVNSQEGQGTSFTIKLPIKNKPS